MNHICHVCGRLVDLIGLQPEGADMCSCKENFRKWRDYANALKLRVAALEAELAAMREGLTGTPKKAGRYWCEWIGRRAAARHEAWWEHDQGWIDEDGDKLSNPVCYWPLPGEVYR